MSDIRLKTDRLELDGETWELRCSMNVLADAQEAFGGDLIEALNPVHRLRSALIFAAAMVNEAAEVAGEETRITPAELGRKLPTARPGDFIDKIMALVYDALDLSTDEEDGKKKQDPAEKVPKTGA